MWEVLGMLQIRDFTQSGVQEEYIKLTPSTKTCKKDDILIARYGASVGKILTGLEGAYNVAIMKTIPNENVLQKRYLYYFLKTAYFQDTIQNVGSRAAQAGFNKSELEDIMIYLPNICEQEKITNILDKAQNLIDRRKEQIQACDELIKSQFIEMFGDLKLNTKGWEIKSFCEFAKIDTNMVKDFEKYGDYPHIGIDSIMKDTGELKGYRTVKEDGVISGKYLFTPKHIIYSKIRPNLNKVALPNFTGVCSADAYPILTIENVCNRSFLGYAMRSEVFLSYILAFSSRTNLPKVNKVQVQGFTLPIPPIELQNEFEQFVQQVDKLKFGMEQSLKELEDNFDSLMQRAFIGELF